MRLLRSIVVVLFLGLTAAGPAAHDHHHFATASHGASRTASHCSVCAAGGVLALAASHAVAAEPLVIAEKVTQRPLSPADDAAHSTASCRAPPLA